MNVKCQLQDTELEENLRSACDAPHVVKCTCETHDFKVAICHTNQLRRDALEIFSTVKVRVVF